MSEELPEGWAESDVGAVAEYINGLAFKPADWESRGRPIIRIQNLSDRTREFNYTTKVFDDRFIVRPGEILVSWSATLDAFRWRGPEAVLNQHIFRVVPRSELVDEGFLFHGLRIVVAEMWASEHTHGSTMRHINRGPFLAHRFPLAPLPEQRRIVEKVEALLEQVNRAKERLDRVPLILRRFRRAVLAAAYAGAVTSEWRLRNRSDPSNPSDLAAPAETLDFELPETWKWASLGSVCTLERGRFSIRPRNDPTCYGGRYPFVQIGDLPSDGGPIVRASQTLNEKGRSVSRSFRPGTILIAIVGATIGNTGVLTVETWCPDSLVAVQPMAQVLGPYIDYFLRWQKLRIRDTSYASGGQPNINLKTLDPYPVPLPPLDEQHGIVRQVEKLFALAATVERRVHAATVRAYKVPQAILSKAFSGELVPTEANLARVDGRTYETADELLARVQRDSEMGASTEKSGVRQALRRTSQAAQKKNVR